MKRLAAALALALVWPAPARPQPSWSPTGAAAITLPEAERRFLERNLAVIAARRGVDAARAQRLVAGSSPPPQFAVGSNFAQFAERRSGGVTGGRLLSPAQSASVGLLVLVERGGKRELRARIADQQIDAAEANVLDALRVGLFQLRQAFFAALLGRANLEVALNNRASLDRTEALLRRQFREGAIPEGDLLRFQASRLSFEADVVSTAQAYATGVATVAALLAEDAAAFRPGTREPPPALSVAGGAGPFAVELRRVLSPVAFEIEGRLDRPSPLGIGRDELAVGVGSRPDVVAAARLAEAAAAGRLLAEAGRRRDVTVNGSYVRSRLSQDLPATREPVAGINQFGLSLSVPIFNTRIVEGNIGVAVAQQGQADAQARAALLLARAEYAAAWATHEQTTALLALYTGGALERAEAAYRSAEQAYLAGGRSLLDVLDALRTLNATRVAANSARYAVLLARAALEQASGVSALVTLP